MLKKYLLFAFFIWRGNSSPPRSIAVIGGGIGGSSAAYFLRESFGDSVSIDIFEKDSRLCGRLATVTIGGKEYESGGSIIHPRNLYLRNFVETLPGLEVANRNNNSVFSLFDGVNYIFKSSYWKVTTAIKMLWMFGWSLMRINKLEENFMSDFQRIYSLQNGGMSFANTSALFYAMGGDQYSHVTEVTAQSYFTLHGVSGYTIDNLVNPALRVNYGQNASVNAFAGAVAMAGIEPGLWSVKGGNKELCYKLVTNSSANLVQEDVTKVGISDEKFTILTSQSAGSQREYDLVILAAAVGGNMYEIDVTEACEGPSPSFDGKKYRRTVANFVKGKLNSSLFDCSSPTTCPTTILTTNQQLFYRSIGYHMPVDYQSGDDIAEGVYKVFSALPLTEDQRNFLFETSIETATVDWNAYPEYRPPDIPGSFVLNKKGFYYTSPIEWAASAMEMSVISAKNAALLAYQNWYGSPFVSRESENRKTEL